MPIGMVAYLGLALSAEDLLTRLSERNELYSSRGAAFERNELYSSRGAAFAILERYLEELQRFKVGNLPVPLLRPQRHHRVHPRRAPGR